MLPLPLPYYRSVEPPRRELTIEGSRFRVIADSPRRLRLEAESPPCLARHKRSRYQVWATVEKDNPGQPGGRIAYFEARRQTDHRLPGEAARADLRHQVLRLTEEAAALADLMGEAHAAAAANSRAGAIVELRERHRALGLALTAYRAQLAEVLAITAPPDGFGWNEYTTAIHPLNWLGDRVHDAWERGDGDLLPPPHAIEGLLGAADLPGPGRARRARQGQPEELLLLAAEADVAARIMELHAGRDAVAAWLAHQEAERGPLEQDA